MKPTTASGASKLSWFPASPLPEPFSLSFLRFFFSFSFFTEADPLSVLSVIAETELINKPTRSQAKYNLTQAGGSMNHLTGDKLYLVGF